VRWVTVYFELAQDRIIGHTGFLGMARTVVYFDEIASFSVCQGPLAYVLHSCQVYIDTDAKCFQSADIRIDLTKSRAMEIYQLICK
jgi:putative membrane protein